MIALYDEPTDLM